MKNSVWLHIIFWVIFVVALSMSFWLRITLPYGDLIHGRSIDLTDVDAYYHMMQADYVYANWPNIESYSQLITWPEGQEVGQRPLNGWLIGTIAKFGGMSVDLVGVYWPAVLGILILIPILFIGWVLWNKWVGLITACSAAVIQGEFYGRLAMGVSDQHALEVFLMCWFVLFYILALKKDKLFAIGSGLFLGLYYMNWVGGPLLTIVVLLFVTAQSIINHLNNIPNRNLTLVTFVTLFISAVMFVLMRPNEPQYVMVYMSAISAPIIIQIVSTVTQKLNKYWYLAILFGSVGCSIGLLFIFIPTVAYWAFGSLESLRGSFGTALGVVNNTISESQPLLSPYGEFTLSLAWGCFGFVFPFGLIGLILMAVKLRKKPELLFVWLWCIVMLLATIMQRRFGYYSAVTMCLTTAYMFYVILNIAGWRKHSKREVKQGKGKVYFSPVIAVVGAIVVLASVVIPSAYLTAKVSHDHPYLMTVAWKEAITYLKDKTPKTNDYGVLSWWDYGYWIAREGQRPATCHPGGGHTLAAAMFLTAQTTKEANSFIIPLKCDYVVIDFLMVKHKFYAIPLLAGKGTLTEQQYNECMVVKLYYSESGLEGYREVFESSTKYEGQSQVKIYQRYVPLVEPCNCGNN